MDGNPVLIVIVVLAMRRRLAAAKVQIAELDRRLSPLGSPPKVAENYRFNEQVARMGREAAAASARIISERLADSAPPDTCVLGPDPNYPGRSCAGPMRCLPCRFWNTVASTTPNEINPLEHEQTR